MALVTVNADVGITNTAGLWPQQIAKILTTDAEGGDVRALGVPHHVDKTLSNPKAGHVYLETTTHWQNKRFKSEQRRNTAGQSDGIGWNIRNREGQIVPIPGDPEGRKLHLDYMSPRKESDDKKPKDPNAPRSKRGGLVKREYRLISRDYDPTVRFLKLVCNSEQAAKDTEVKILATSLPLKVGLSLAPPAVLVTGSSRSMLRLFGVKNASRGFATKLSKEINQKAPLPASGLFKKITKKQTEADTVEPLAGLTFEADSSIKPLPDALPATALLVYINPAEPNDARIELPKPPIVLEERSLPQDEVQGQLVPFLSPSDLPPQEGGPSSCGEQGGGETPLQSEDEGDEASPVDEPGQGRSAIRMETDEVVRLLTYAADSL